MNKDRGSYTAGNVVRFMWDTSSYWGDSATRTGTGTLRVARDGLPTPNLINFTDTVDFDGIVGINSCELDTSQDPFFFIMGRYHIIATNQVIGGTTASATIATFKIVSAPVVSQGGAGQAGGTNLSLGLGIS